MNPKKRMKEDIAKHDFHIHFVFDAYQGQHCADIHTHGLQETFQHQELQIVIAIDPNAAHAILWNAVELIKKGTMFSPEKEYEDILENHKVVFWQTDNPSILRLILPDPEGISVGSPYLPYSLQTQLTANPNPNG